MMEIFMFNKKEYDKQWWKDNPEKQKKYRKKYNILKNKEKVLECARRYCENNRQKLREKNRIYYKNNNEKFRKSYNKYRKNKYKKDLKYNLNYRISCLMRKSLKKNKNGYHWEDLIGYTLNELIKHLKETMPSNYIWQDYLEGKLQIDHIIPIDVFNFTKPEHIDFKRCWALINLRLLPKEENRNKSNKLSRPFQPALKI